jgi:hypothetical protein
MHSAHKNTYFIAQIKHKIKKKKVSLCMKYQSFDSEHSVLTVVKAELNDLTTKTKIHHKLCM